MFTVSWHPIQHFPSVDYRWKGTLSASAPLGCDISRLNVPNPIEINDGYVIHPTACVKVLGVHVDTLLTYHDHISYVQ